MARDGNLRYSLIASSNAATITSFRHLFFSIKLTTFLLHASLSAVHCTWCRVALLKISCYDLSLVTGCHTDPVKSSTRAPPPVYDNTATCVYPRLLFAPLQHYISTDTPVSGGECRMCQAELVITLFILTYPHIQLLGHFLHTTNTTIPKADYTLQIIDEILEIMYKMC